MEYQREVERKFVILGSSYDEVYKFLSSTFYVNLGTTISYDLYWGATGVDFIRLRENSQELTVKVTDKQTIIDRIEENAKVSKEDMKAMERAMTLVHGHPMRLTKKFSVFTGDLFGTEDRVIYCIYEVQDDPKKRLFFEVEAPDIESVDEALSALKPIFELQPQTKSLYQIFAGVLP